MKKMIFKALGIVLLGILALVVILFLLNTPYETEYFEKAGISGSHLYKDIYASKGPPIREEVIHEKNATTMHLTYPGYIFYFIGSKDIEKSNYMLGNVRITDPEYKLGKYNIGIGTSKAIVEKAYRNKKKIKDIKFGFIDNRRWIVFNFDSAEKVSEIKVFIGP